MATLTRTRPTFQVDSQDDVQAERRPLHLDIPTPFPRLAYSQSTAGTPGELPLPQGDGEETEGNVGGVAVASAVAGSSREQEAAKETSTDSVSGLSVHVSCVSGAVYAQSTEGHVWSTSSSLLRRRNRDEIQMVIASVSWDIVELPDHFASSPLSSMALGRPSLAGS